jgi:hypothetical protein
MAGESISIELFDPLRNEEPLVKLHGTHFTGRDSARKRRSYVHWLLSNPLDRGIYLAAYVNGAFAGFLGFMAREVVGFGQRYRAALAFGAMTLPEFGGRGLYKRLAHAGWDEARNRGFHFALGYTVQPYVLDMELRMGWKRLGAAPVMVLVLDSGAAFRTAFPRVRAWARLVAPVGWVFKKIARHGMKSLNEADCSIKAVSHFSPEYDALTASLREAEILTFSKDPRALEWLYLSEHNPFEYDILEARRAGRLIGFAVGRKMDLMGLDGYGILDLIASPGEPNVVRALAAGLVEVALMQQPEVIGALVSSRQEAEEALRSLGFIYSRRSFSLIYRPTQEVLPSVLIESSRWSHCWGNNDTV